MDILFLINALFSIFMQIICLLNLISENLTIKKRIIIFLLYFLNVFFVTYVLGNLSAVTSLVTVGIFLYFFTFNSWRNIGLLLICYIYCVAITNLGSVILGQFSINNDELISSYYLFIPYATIMTMIIGISSYFIGKFISKKLIKVFLSKNALRLMIVNLVLIVLIFICNIVLGEYAGYSERVITFNSILFALYAIASTVVILALLKATYIETQLKIKQDSFANLQSYTAQIEKMYSSLRSFKHDYINIMTSLTGYIEENDLSGLKSYFYREIVPIGKSITTSNYNLNQLMNVSPLEIKSILSSKIIYAHELGIDLNIEVYEPVNITDIDIVDLARILGIFWDNAIEAAQETEAPKISFSIIKNIDAVAIILKNTYLSSKAISLHDINKPTFSTKGENRGMGLYNVQNILNRYPNILIDTQYDTTIFSQHLEISNNSVIK